MAEKIKRIWNILWSKEQNLDKVDMSKITRIEIIDHSLEHMAKGLGARAYQKHNCKDVVLSYQDDNRTLKIFIK